MDGDDQPTAAGAFEGLADVLTESLAAELRGLLDVMPDDITIVDGSGHVAWASARSAARLGYDRDELIGRPSLELVHPDDVELVRLALDVVVHEPDRVIPLTYRSRRRDGSTGLQEVSGALVELGPAGDRQPYIVLSARDRDAQSAVDLALQQVASGASLDVTLKAMLGFVTSGGLGVRAGMLLGPQLAEDEEFFEGSCPPELVAAASWPHGAPWDEAAHTGETVELTDLTGCSPAVREVARSLGLVSCLAVPVHSASASRPAVLVLWFESLVIHAIAPLWLSRELVPVMRLMLEQFFWRSQLQHAARHDALTGLANRSQVFEVLERSLGRCRDGDLVGVLYLDLDGFKPVNDQFGHAAGDDVLADAAARFRLAVRPGDLVGRMGGDEFAVVCPGCATLDEAVAIGERLVAALAPPVMVPVAHLVPRSAVTAAGASAPGDGTDESPASAPMSIGVSVGVTVAGVGDTAEGALRRADAALYAAKADGRGRVRVDARLAT